MRSPRLVPPSLAWLLAALLAPQLACEESAVDTLVVYTDSDLEPLVEAFLEPIPDEGVAIELTVTPDPEGDAEDARGGRMRVSVAADLGCHECFTLEGGEEVFHLRADGPLAVQYGLAHLLEIWGYRFHHPFRTAAPATLEPIAAGALEPSPVEPDQSLRGLHLHTLHPIEALDAMWSGGPDALDRAERIVDWTVKNRGNHIQWVALDDALGAPDHVEDWQEHTRAVTALAHDRGMTTGIGVQLFGSANLQNAFDLLDDVGTADEQRAAIDERLAVLTDDLGFDTYALSFGEFFGEEPATFVAAVDLAYDVLQEQAPGAEMSSWIHVGDNEELLVEYEGQTLPYYFLAQFADPAIVPWVHSVMYYTLFEDAGGAYHHDEFDDHRAFLLDRLAGRDRVAYVPESAYWVAFDNPVPTYLPLYMRSRWHDLREIADATTAAGADPLDEHVLFSTGWEWGYWQNDVATLRMNHHLDDDGWEGQVRWMYAPFGSAGRELATAVIALAELQHDTLIGQRLAAYLAGRDAAMDAGYAVGIVSQPQRVTLTELSLLDAPARATFADEVISPLGQLATDTAALDEQVTTLAAAAENPWFDEVRDGIRVDAERARFSHALYAAVLAHADGGDDDGWLAEADAALDAARAVVERRHGALHDPAPEPLLTPFDNPTIYDYGYLRYADELCFWERERIEAANLLEGSDETLPGCLL